ncbi:hypothetical protein TNCV_3259341 [Trichonephila clavipes]|nr:hypothetical protein TNCV_3259341 [Trichonephila clavipes]
MCSAIRFFNARKVKPFGIQPTGQDFKPEVYGENAMSDVMVRKWVRQFNDGFTNIHNKAHKGDQFCLVEISLISMYLPDWADNQRLKKQHPFSLEKTLGLPSVNAKPHSLCSVRFDLKLEGINFHEELLTIVVCVKHSEIPDLIRQ